MLSYVEKNKSRINVEEYYSNHERFGTAFVINLPQRKDRLAQAKKTLSKVGITPTIFEAVNGKDIEVLTHLTAGEIGCLLSHLTILAVAAEHPDQENYTFIFEDDIVTNLTSMQGIYNDLEGLSPDLIYLGKCLENCARIKKVKGNIYTAFSPLCAHAIMIKNSFAKKVLKKVQFIAIDVIYPTMIEGNKVYVLHPSAFYQDVFSESNLRSSSFQNCTECSGDFPLKQWGIIIGIALLVYLLIFYVL